MEEGGRERGRETDRGRERGRKRERERERSDHCYLSVIAAYKTHNISASKAVINTVNNC